MNGDKVSLYTCVDSFQSSATPQQSFLWPRAGVEPAFTRQHREYPRTCAYSVSNLWQLATLFLLLSDYAYYTLPCGWGDFSICLPGHIINYYKIQRTCLSFLSFWLYPFLYLLHSKEFYKQ